MNHGALNWIESLETRRLLASYGLDLSFGSAGAAKVRSSLLIQPVAGGNILVVSDVNISRITDSGQIDSTFAPRGVYPNTIGNESTALATDDRLFVGGSGTHDNRTLNVLAYNLDGTIVSGFGSAGRATETIASPVAGSEVAAVSARGFGSTGDGGVFVLVDVIAADTSTFEVQKIKADGTFDSTFADHGILTIHTSDPFSEPNILGLASGKFVILTQADASNASASRYNADGTIDKTFGTSGKTMLPGFSTHRVADGPFMVEQPDHKILIAGQTLTDNDGEHAKLARLQANGLLDGNFATNGILQIPSVDTVTDGISSIALDTQQRIVVGDIHDNLYRFAANGSADNSFGSHGIVDLTETLPAAGSHTPYIVYMATDASDRILIGDYDFLARVAPRVPIALSNRTIFINGTSGDDTVDVKTSGSNVKVTFNGTVQSYAAADVDAVNVTADAGDNMITVSADLITAVSAGAGDDTIITAGGDDSIVSGDGNDSISTGDGSDTIESGDGNDFLDSGEQSESGQTDSITAGSGNDTIHSGIGAATINVGAGDDDITTGDGVKDVTTHGGHKTIQMNGSNNTLVCLEGHNNISVANSGTTLVIANDGTNTINITGAAAAVRTGSGNCTITTGDGNDTITTGGADTINSAGGDDFIRHEARNLDGQTVAEETILVNAGAGNDTILGGESPDTIHGGDGNDYIKTGGSNDSLYGEAGADTIRGGLGNDLISGGGGRDHLLGQQGIDRIYAGNGNDAIDAGPGNDRLFGQAGDDVIVAGSGNDQIDGGAGSDYLAAGPGDDTLTANDSERDSVYGGDGNDSAHIDAQLDQLRSIETVL